MDLVDQLQVLAKRASNSADSLQNEEATKMALITPFIQALGYDIFNPGEVMPEYTADFPEIKQGERVDYAILENGRPKILVEAKPYRTNLKDTEKGQLSRYFHVTEARIGILTNGRIYQFYTDLDNANVMDPTPFAEIDLLNLSNAPVKEIKKLTKSMYDLAGLLDSAEKLKYLGGVKEEIKKEFADPGEWFIKEMASRVHSGKSVTSKVKDQFKPIIQEAILAYINDRVNDRLKSAIEVGNQAEADKAEDDSAPIVAEGNGIETTPEEIEGLYIVRAICATDIDASRLIEKDTKSYFNILVDGNTWKSVVRLYFNGSNKKVEIFDDVEPKFVELATVSQLYSCAERIRNSLRKRLAQ
jgi:hypothetical protein